MEKRKIGEVRPPIGNFDVYETDAVVELFADGVHSFALNGAIAKLDLYSAEPPKEGSMMGRVGLEGAVERRVLSARVVIPAKSLLEFVLQVATMLRDNEDQLIAGLHTDVEGLKKAIDAFVG